MTIRIHFSVVDLLGKLLMILGTISSFSQLDSSYLLFLSLDLLIKDFSVLKL